MIRELKELWVMAVPSMKISIRADFGLRDGIYRVRRWFVKTKCERCGLLYRDMVEGCIGGENLCGKCNDGGHHA